MAIGYCGCQQAPALRGRHRVAGAVAAGLRAFVALVTLFATVVPITTAAPMNTACTLVPDGLQIDVTSVPDDGDWGPTLEITVKDSVQILSRLIAVESRPVENIADLSGAGRETPERAAGGH